MTQTSDRLTLLRRSFQTDFEASPLVASLRDLAGARARLRMGRSLSTAEIALLVSQGNEAEDWGHVRLIGEGSLAQIRGNRFEGDVTIKPPTGSFTDPHGRLWKAGIRRSLVKDCILGNACIDTVGRLERCVIEEGAILAQCGLVTCVEGQRFGLGRVLHPGDETGSRRLWLWDNALVETCALAASLTPEEQKNFQNEIEAALSPLSSDFAFVGKGACLLAARNVQDTWVGPGAFLECPTLVSGCALMSVTEHPCHLGADARVVDCILQMGATVDAGGSTLRCLLMEFSGVDETGKVADSVLGPNTHAAKGEITASLVGPFVGFHHQALLIAAIWPEGRGNIAYGANVGSNHTGKKPDQEIRPGEGMFFGLGCSIKFPANFDDAPYSLFATGVVTAPQRLRYPFSLVSVPSFPPSPETQGLNEIRPGYMWSDNMYALARNSFKYVDRDRSVRHALRPQAQPGSQINDGFFCGRLFQPELCIKVAWASAAFATRKQTSSPYIMPTDLPGLGKNVLRRENESKSWDAYTRYLKLYLLRWGAEPSLWKDEALAQQILTPALKALEIKPGEGLRDALRSWRPLLLELPSAVRQSLERDHYRGPQIIDDYAYFHANLDADTVCRRILESVETLDHQLSTVLK